MRRLAICGLAAFLAFPLLCLSPVHAGEDEELAERIQSLQGRVDVLEARRAAALERAVEEYLSGTEAWRGAQADTGLDGVSIWGRLTAVGQATSGLDEINRHAVSGDVDLNFDFDLTENLDAFIHMTANTAMPESVVEPVGLARVVPSKPTAGAGFEAMFDGIAGRTFSGMTDGIGVDGTQPVAPGSITVYEAGFHNVVHFGDRKLHWAAGELDPRERFLGNAFAGDENTQFLNNLFDDSPSILWLTDASGRTSFGVMAWMAFGDNEDYYVKAGWFNQPGAWFDHGQAYAEVGWHGEVNGRAMNLSLLLVADEFFVDANRDGSVGLAGSWDWLVTEALGVFVLFGTSFDDVNPIETDISLGFQWTGMIPNRETDVFGLAVGLIKANTNTTSPGFGFSGPNFQDQEWTAEVYYRFMLDEGKLQISPHLMVVNDPGGNGTGWLDGRLVLVGLRIHVPF